MRRTLFIMILIGGAIGSRIPAHHRDEQAPVHVGTPDDHPVETVLERRDSGHFSTIADVNGEPLHFIVDTGADTVALTEEDARTAHIAFDPARFTVVAHGAAGDIYGQEVQLSSVALDGKRVDNVGAIVMRGAGISLLGQNYLRHLSVAISGDTMRLND